MEAELKEIKEKVEKIDDRLNGYGETMSAMNSKLDGIIATQKITDKHPIKVTTQIETEGQTSSIQAGIVKRVLRWPSLPWAICIVAILVMAVWCFAVLSGRQVSSFFPASHAAPSAP